MRAVPGKKKKVAVLKLKLKKVNVLVIDLSDIKA